MGGLIVYPIGGYSTLGACLVDRLLVDPLRLIHPTLFHRFSNLLYLYPD